VLSLRLGETSWFWGQRIKWQGWKKYSFEASIDPGSSEEVWVAVGIPVRWETYLVYYLDDVDIQIR